MSKQSASAVYISGTQAYGYLLPPWPELEVDIGHPTSTSSVKYISGAATASLSIDDTYPAYSHTDGVWYRNYSNVKTLELPTCFSSSLLSSPPPSSSSLSYNYY